MVLQFNFPINLQYQNITLNSSTIDESILKLIVIKDNYEIKNAIESWETIEITQNQMILKINFNNEAYPLSERENDKIKI